ncbi:hypothetical protein, partial [Anaeromyxobacter sp. SG26]|uniref:hypothetical protein n=1 Tax=Anaeromyxobacter sp. SG26 TaxID=2925407 RepID=UPI001F5A19C0
MFPEKRRARGCTRWMHGRRCPGDQSIEQGFTSTHGGGFDAVCERAGAAPSFFAGSSVRGRGRRSVARRASGRGRSPLAARGAAPP